VGDLKIPGAQVQLPAGPAGPAAPAGAQVQLPLGKKIDAPPPLGGGLADAFKGIAQQGAQATAQLTGQAVGLPLSAAELAVQAKQITNPGDAQGAFQGAYAVIKDQLLDHPALDKDDLGQRANEFFTEYAQAFVQTASEPPPPPPPQPGEQPQPPQQQQPQERPLTQEQQKAMAREFADSLKGLGFGALKNVANGKDGVENAFQLLSAEGKKEFEALAKEQQIKIEGQFPPKPEGEIDIPDARPPPAEEAQTQAQAPASGTTTETATTTSTTTGTEAEGTQAPAEEEVQLPGNRPQEDEEEDIAKRKKKPGKNILWSVLGTLRREDEQVRKAEEKWDRVVVAGLLFLLLVVLLTIAVVSL
jgi:hypothetical protein